jgi:hypothetical protein
MFSQRQRSFVAGDKDANDIPPIFGSMFGGGKEAQPPFFAARLGEA